MAERASGRLRALVFGIGACLVAAASAVLAAPAPAPAPSKPIPLVHPKARTASHARGHSHARHAAFRRRSRRFAPAPVQTPPPAAAPVASPSAHDGVVTIAAEEAEGTDARAAADIQSALGGFGVRVMPVLVDNALTTLHDLPNSPDVDLALARTDALDQEKVADPAADHDIGYVARLFDEEICILARPSIAAIGQLNGKKVAVGLAGSSDWVTGRNIFGKLGLHPQFVESDVSTALAALDKGQIDAVVLVDGKPAPVLFAPRAKGVHVLAVPYQPALQDQYYPARLTHADYPQLVAGAPVETIAVATLLVAPTDAADPTRSQRIETFTQSFLTHFDALLALGRHPKWHDVNLAADAPGWTRIPSAKRWLDTAETEEEKQFDAYVAARAAPMPTTAAGKDHLFQEFVKWNSTRTR